MKICVHMMVKNEESYLWFAVMSVIDFVDRVMIWDTGSSDNTLKIADYIKSLHSDKVEVCKISINSKENHTKARNEMIEKTKEDWILIVDGDEVWWDDSVTQITAKLKEGKELETVVNPFVNLLGDIYHFQDEGNFRNTIDGKSGCITVRAIGRGIPGLHVGGIYPKEGYLDGDNIPVYERDKKYRIFLNTPYLHFTHLKRSNHSSDAIERKVLKEDGISFPLDYYYPEVFFRARPDWVVSPWVKLDRYKLFENTLITLVKKLKRLVYSVDQ